MRDDLRSDAMDFMSELHAHGRIVDALLVGELVDHLDEIAPLREQLAEARTYVGILEARLAEHERSREHILGALRRDL